MAVGFHEDTAPIRELVLLYAEEGKVCGAGKESNMKSVLKHKRGIENGRYNARQH